MVSQRSISRGHSTLHHPKVRNTAEVRAYVDSQSQQFSPAHSSCTFGHQFSIRTWSPHKTQQHAPSSSASCPAQDPLLRCSPRAPAAGSHTSSTRGAARRPMQKGPQDISFWKTLTSCDHVYIYIYTIQSLTEEVPFILLIGSKKIKKEGFHSPQASMPSAPPPLFGRTRMARTV